MGSLKKTDSCLLRVGIDTGGTFTDFVAYDGNSLVHEKVLSNPEMPELPFFQLIRRKDFEDIREVVNGSTVAVNTFLERKGSRFAFVTTKGFRDILFIGRQNRPKLYDFHAEKRPHILERSLCFEINERIAVDGTVIRPVAHRDIELLVETLKSEKICKVSLCLLNSFANPEHEKIISEKLEQNGIDVYASFLILPEFREYERAFTVSLNSYVSGAVEGYLKEICGGIGNDFKKLGIMSSSGGAVNPEEVRRRPALTMFSGPAGGVAASKELGDLIGVKQLISVDMGGTSTDVALIDGEIAIRQKSEIDGFPIMFPSVDMVSIGAGGGSVVWVDRGGALRVGPMSAGSKPGPACYGFSDIPTLTDASLLLGWIPYDRPLANRVVLDVKRAEKAFRKIADLLGVTLEKACMMSARVAVSNMASAVRLVSQDRGKDPGRFTLIAYGGSGPVYGCHLAEELRVGRVIVPAHPGLFSATGLMLSDEVISFSKTVLKTVNDENAQALENEWNNIACDAAKRLGEDRYDEIYHMADMRYKGQSHELMIEASRDGEINMEGLRAGFERKHIEKYGFTVEDGDIEAVNLRVFVKKKSGISMDMLFEGMKSVEKDLRKKHVFFSEDFMRSAEVYEKETAYINRGSFEPGERIEGPLVIHEDNATTVVPEGWIADIGKYGEILLSKVKRNNRTGS